MFIEFRYNLSFRVSIIAVLLRPLSDGWLCAFYERKSSVLTPSKHSVTSLVSAPYQDGDRLQYNSSFLNSKSFPIKNHFDAATVWSNIQIKFLNFNCFTSCGPLRHSAFTTHSLLHDKLWRLTYDVKLVITTDRVRSSKTIYLVILNYLSPLIWHDKENKKYLLSTKAHWLPEPVETPVNQGNCHSHNTLILGTFRESE